MRALLLVGNTLVSLLILGILVAPCMAANSFVLDHLSSPFGIVLLALVWFAVTMVATAYHRQLKVFTWPVFREVLFQYACLLVVTLVIDHFFPHAFHDDCTIIRHHGHWEIPASLLPFFAFSQATGGKLLLLSWGQKPCPEGQR